MKTASACSGNRFTAPSLLIARLQREGLLYQRIESVRGARVRVNGRWLLNFVSTDYLGLGQSTQVKKAVLDSFKTWGISLGTPRLLGESAHVASFENMIAETVCLDKALVFPSTTHAALDVLPLLAGPGGMLFIDEWAYPISLEGAHAAQKRGSSIVRFRHNDPAALKRAMELFAAARDKVIVCDGIYAYGGQKAPLTDYIRLAKKYDARIYLDDAHGIGILGEGPSVGDMPYGYGGGGTPNYFALNPSKRIIHIGSLSKAFGIPLAFAAGNSACIDAVKKNAQTYTHSSQPSLPLLAAAMTAMRIHALRGDALRSSLFRRVRQFLKGLARIGLKLQDNNYFPIQTIPFTKPDEAEKVAKMARAKGVWCLLQLRPPDNPTGGVVRFVVTALHKEEDIEEAIEVLSDKVH